MTKRIRHTVGKILVAASLILTGSTVQAQTAMTLSQAIETGLKSSKTLRISDYKVRAGQANYFAVNTNKFAWLKFSGSYTRLSKVDPFSLPMGGSTITVSPAILDNYSTKLTLAQPLFMGNKITASIDAAEHSFNAVKEDYNKDKAELILSIKNAYWTLFKAVQMKKVLDETVQQIQAHVNDAKNMLAAGLLTSNDVLKLQVQLADTKYKQVDANNAVKLSNIALCNVLGISLTETITPVSTAASNVQGTEEVTDLLAAAFTKRPELKSADYRIKSSQSGIDIAKSAWYPQVNVVGNYTYSRPNSRIFPTKDEFKGTWDVSLALSFDIWDWNSRSYQTEQAEAQMDQAKEAYAVTRDAITLEVTQNYLNMNQAKEKMSIAKLAQQQAEENFRITGEKFKQGTALSSDLIDAEVAFLQATTNYTTALVDFELANAKLQRSTGDTGF